jgi:hypothetical protein
MSWSREWLIWAETLVDLGWLLERREEAEKVGYLPADMRAQKFGRQLFQLVLGPLRGHRLYRLLQTSLELQCGSMTAVVVQVLHKRRRTLLSQLVDGSGQDLEEMGMRLVLFVGDQEGHNGHQF